MNLTTGTVISQLPTGTIDNMQAVIPISIGMPSSPQTIQASLTQLFALGGIALISTTTVGVGGVADVTFSAIPATYTHLRIMYSARSNRVNVGDPLGMQINGDTGAKYDWLKKLITHSATLVTTEGLAGTFADCGQLTGSTAPAGDFSTGFLELPGYAGANSNKSGYGDCVMRSAATTGTFRSYQSIFYFASTSAISSIRLFPSIGTAFEQYSVFSLFGYK